MALLRLLKREMMNSPIIPVRQLDAILRSRDFAQVIGEVLSCAPDTPPFVSRKKDLISCDPGAGEEKRGFGGFGGCNQFRGLGERCSGAAEDYQGAYAPGKEAFHGSETYGSVRQARKNA